MRVLQGAEAVAGQLATFQRTATLSTTRPALVNGTTGLVNTVDDELISIMSCTVTNEKTVAVEILSDPDRLAQLDLGHLEN